MKTLSYALRGLLVAVGLILLSQGVLWGFFPAGNLAANGIQATTTLGMNARWLTCCSDRIGTSA